MKTVNRIMPAGLLAAMLLAGCSVAPVYEKPAVDMPAAYKEADKREADKREAGAAQAGKDAAAVPADQWKQAQPAEDAARGQWWTVFGDADLNALEDQALAANQNLKAAAARLAQARATLRGARSDLYPQVSAGFGPTRQRPSPVSQGLPDGTPTTPYTLYRAQASVSYEADLFGRVASSVDAARAQTEQGEALLRSVQLALQADVAQNYFQVRELDADQQLYTTTVELRANTLKLIQRRFDEGDISELDLARARTELASAQSEALEITRQRAAAEHALAILLGQTPAAFSMPAQPLTRVSVAVPAGLPSALLERRPDIAAAERAMAAANARVGVAKAAYFPSLSLTGGLGFESGDIGNLFNWSSRTFLLGPLVGTMLSLPIFDGGRRDAGVAQARAVYEEDVANYRQSVLDAFREVEDNLANLRVLKDQHQAQDAAVASAMRAAQISQAQYREGSVSYLDVIDADRSVLQQRRESVRLDGERARSTVNLIRALGGGWS